MEPARTARPLLRAAEVSRGTRLLQKDPRGLESHGRRTPDADTPTPGASPPGNGRDRNSGSGHTPAGLSVCRQRPRRLRGGSPALRDPCGPRT